jgi:hypothetical protein
MTFIKGWLYVLFLLSSLVFLGITHRGSVAGDYIFRGIGIPSWSDPVANLGLHYSVIFGLVMLILSGSLTIRHFRQRYKKYVGRIVWISCIIFFNVYPFLTEQVYYLTHMKKTGIEAVDLLKKDSRCMYGTQEDKVTIQCTIRIINYGGQNENVSIRPIIQDYGNRKGIWSFAEVQYQEITLKKRSNIKYNIHFESKPDDRIAELRASGTADIFGLEFVKDGQIKEVITN